MRPIPSPRVLNRNGRDAATRACAACQLSRAILSDPALSINCALGGGTRESPWHGTSGLVAAAKARRRHRGAVHTCCNQPLQQSQAVIYHALDGARNQGQSDFGYCRACATQPRGEPAAWHHQGGWVNGMVWPPFAERSPLVAHSAVQQVTQCSSGQRTLSRTDVAVRLCVGGLRRGGRWRAVAPLCALTICRAHRDGEAVSDLA
mmetsp:Transcript_6485/g.15104  ORF Transcript_6485/g.15104 Transcript_6485/m.15104 type:complete len:205 (+) Transcript_6485:959-1573(+)|eukprot:4151773-Prymnesium_polylepis.1